MLMKELEALRAENNRLKRNIDHYLKEKKEVEKKLLEVQAYSVIILIWAVAASMLFIASVGTICLSY